MTLCENRKIKVERERKIKARALMLKASNSYVFKALPHSSSFCFRLLQARDGRIKDFITNSKQSRRVDWTEF